MCHGSVVADLFSIVAPVVGVLCLFLFYYAILSVISSFCNHLDGEKRVDCFTLTVFLMSCDCYCFVALPHGAVGRSAVILTLLSILADSDSYLCSFHWGEHFLNI